MGATWEFIKRHKGKVVTGGVLIGGAIAYSLNAPSKQTSSDHTNFEDDYMKVQARRHYVFDTNHRSCDQSITDLAPSIKSLVQTRFEIDHLVRKIQSSDDLSNEEKIQVWNQLKLTAISRLVAISYSYALLTVALKAQISILASEICEQFEAPKKSNVSMWNYIPTRVLSMIGMSDETPQNTSMSGVDASSRQVFLQCIQFFTTRGIFELFSLIEGATKEQCSSISLKEPINRETFRQLLDKLESLVSAELSTKFSHMVAPILSNEAQSGDQVLRLLGRLVIALESSWSSDAISALLDSYFSTAAKVLTDSSQPLAKVLPMLSDTFDSVAEVAYDSPLQQSLCSTDIHRFSMNVFNMHRN